MRGGVELATAKEESPWTGRPSNWRKPRSGQSELGPSGAALGAVGRAGRFGGAVTHAFAWRAQPRWRGWSPRARPRRRIAPGGALWCILVAGEATSRMGIAEAPGATTAASVMAGTTTPGMRCRRIMAWVRCVGRVRLSVVGFGFGGRVPALSAATAAVASAWRSVGNRKVRAAAHPGGAGERDGQRSDVSDVSGGGDRRRVPVEPR
jgi:hypothetical protein